MGILELLMTEIANAIFKMALTIFFFGYFGVGNSITGNGRESHPDYN